MLKIIVFQQIVDISIAFKMADARDAKNEIFISKLFQLSQQKPTDILLYCKDGELGTHKIILSCASSFFEVRLIKLLNFQAIKLSLSFKGLL